MGERIKDRQHTRASGGTVHIVCGEHASTNRGRVPKAAPAQTNSSRTRVHRGAPRNTRSGSGAVIPTRARGRTGLDVAYAAAVATVNVGDGEGERTATRRGAHHEARAARRHLGGEPAWSGGAIGEQTPPRGYGHAARGANGGGETRGASDSHASPHDWARDGGQRCGQTSARPARTLCTSSRRRPRGIKQPPPYKPAFAERDGSGHDAVRHGSRGAAGATQHSAPGATEHAAEVTIPP